VVNLEGIGDFEHQKEGGRVAICFFIFLLSKLPIGHDVPHDLIFVQW
jgi:hypothetical protein